MTDKDEKFVGTTEMLEGVAGSQFNEDGIIM